MKSKTYHLAFNGLVLGALAATVTGIVLDRSRWPRYVIGLILAYLGAGLLGLSLKYFGLVEGAPGSIALIGAIPGLKTFPQGTALLLASIGLCLGGLSWALACGFAGWSAGKLWVGIFGEKLTRRCEALIAIHKAVEADTMPNPEEPR